MLQLPRLIEGLMLFSSHIGCWRVFLCCLEDIIPVKHLCWDCCLVVLRVISGWRVCWCDHIGVRGSGGHGAAAKAAVRVLGSLEISTTQKGTTKCNPFLSRAPYWFQWGRPLKNRWHAAALVCKDMCSGVFKWSAYELIRLLAIMSGKFQGRRKGVRGLRCSKFTIQILRAIAKYDLVHSSFDFQVTFYFYRRTKAMKGNRKSFWQYVNMDLIIISCSVK